MRLGIAIDRPHKVCLKPGCLAITQNANRLCDRHQGYEKEKRSASYRKADRKRDNSNSRGYNWKWRKASADFLMNEPLCRDCLKRGQTVPATVVDHIVPHRGDFELFWDISNWQPLCRKCHDSKTAKGL